MSKIFPSCAKLLTVNTVTVSAKFSFVMNYINENEYNIVIIYFIETSPACDNGQVKI